MTDVKNHGHGARRDMARQLIAGASLVYHVIVASFGVSSMIA
jgi:hypothetical protein